MTVRLWFFCFMKRINIKNERYGKLVVLKEGPKIKKHTAWICKCDCGKIKNVMTQRLRVGSVISCGCVIEGHRSNRLLKYKGLKTHKRSKEYNAWKRLRLACNCKTNKDYPRYGGRGISVCPQWNSFMQFYKDMGPAPTKKHSIDRIDVNGNYEPSNCRWATLEEQNNNKRTNVLFFYNGKKVSLAQLSRVIKMDHRTLRYRLLKYYGGWNEQQRINDALDDAKLKYILSMGWQYT